ncbi:TPA: hypothetical protein DF272_02795 [Candidatus Falkowbacteria bacterium]|nr:hypothetical protein [Candidatus Falkowbacteria bacterium]
MSNHIAAKDLKSVKLLLSVSVIVSLAALSYLRSLFVVDFDDSDIDRIMTSYGLLVAAAGFLGLFMRLRVWPGLVGRVENNDQLAVRKSYFYLLFMNALIELPVILGLIWYVTYGGYSFSNILFGVGFIYAVLFLFMLPLPSLEKK